MNMREYYNAMGVDPFGILPQTFLVKNLGDQEFIKFEKYYNSIKEKAKEMQKLQQSEIKKYMKSSKGKTPKRKRFVPTKGSDEDSENSGDVDDEIGRIRKKHRIPLNTWIIKPGENTNRGFGINVSSSLSEIRRLITQNDPDRSYII
jgi:hypothetical protein